ncbi:membrane protein [Knoellia flava TL1]|uniref:Membrane protein n=1 Tax=Knoellia flava TL1 TaxID=1385518 RepID=A0ABR4XB34_9MICO|nr:membrane protein [Knoellia flava TL1]
MRVSRDDGGSWEHDRVQNFLIRVLINAVALWVAAWLVAGISFGDDDAWTSKVVTVVLVALVFGLVNAVIRPIAKVLSFPFIVLTLGLFTFIVNAFMLQITEWIAEPLGLAFTIDEFFWDAVIGAIIITVVSWLLSVVLPDGDDD